MIIIITEVNRTFDPEWRYNIRKKFRASAIISTLSREIKSKHDFDVFNSFS